MASGMQANVLRRPDTVHLADIKPRPAIQVSWERIRHRQAHWLVECAAEFVSLLFAVCARVRVNPMCDVT